MLEILSAANVTGPGGEAPSSESPRITLLTGEPDAGPSWDRYVRSHEHGSPFHLTAWQRLLESSLGHVPYHLLAREAPGGEIVGILPLFLVKSRIFGRMLISTPQAAYGGILADSSDVGLSLLRHSRALAAGLKVQFLELRHYRNCLSDPSLVTKDLYVTFRRELDGGAERIFLSIPRKTRAEIRRGMSNGLEFREGALSANEFFAIYSQNVHRLGTPVFPGQLFAGGPKEFGQECRIFSVHRNGKAIAAVWTLLYRDEVIPYYGGSLHDYNHLGTNNFMYWMLLKYGIENGYRVFDFGRSKKGTGSFAFKKRWGMDMHDLPYQYVLVRRKSMPDTSPLNPRLALFIEVWKRLPPALANYLGPKVSRHLT